MTRLDQNRGRAMLARKANVPRRPGHPRDRLGEPQPLGLRRLPQRLDRRPPRPRGDPGPRLGPQRLRAGRRRPRPGPLRGPRRVPRRVGRAGDHRDGPVAHHPDPVRALVQRRASSPTAATASPAGSSSASRSAPRTAGPGRSCRPITSTTTPRRGSPRTSPSSSTRRRSSPSSCRPGRGDSVRSGRRRQVFRGWAASYWPKPSQRIGKARRRLLAVGVDGLEVELVDPVGQRHLDREVALRVGDVGRARVASGRACRCR